MRYLFRVLMIVAIVSIGSRAMAALPANVQFMVLQVTFSDFPAGSRFTTAQTQTNFNNIATLVSFPLVFLSNAFVDSARLPGPLKPIAEWNPVSTFVQAARELFGNTTPLRPVPDAWPLQHAVPVSVGWSVLILVVFVPLATRLYKRAVSQ